MFDQFYSALGWIMNLFYSVIPSYGVAIMGLTALVMLVITPLTVKSTRSMLQMQRLQPEMKRIQEKYKGDKERLNQELMAFYQENKINPLGGCLPMVAQLPVFMLMYRLMRGLTFRPGGLGTGTGHIAGQTGVGKAITPWVFTEQNFQPEHLDHSWKMFKALSSTNRMNFLGMDLSLSASQALKSGILVAIPFLLLLVVMLVTGIVQNRQLQARNSSAAANPQQQAIMKLMPFFLPVVSFGFPAGLALYWCTQNLCRIGTNHYITKSVYAKEHPKAVVDTTGRRKGASVEPDGTGGASRKAIADKDADGKASGRKGPASNGNGNGNGNGKSGGGGGGSKKKAAAADLSGASGDKTRSSTPRTPGKSVKSQKAQQNATGKRSSRTPAPGGNRRRSGESRGGSKSER